MKEGYLLELVIEKLRWLRLPGMAKGLSDLLERANKENLSGLEFLSRLANRESESAQQRG